MFIDVPLCGQSVVGVLALTCLWSMHAALNQLSGKRSNRAMVTIQSPVRASKSVLVSVGDGIGRDCCW